MVPWASSCSRHVSRAAPSRAAARVGVSGAWLHQVANGTSSHGFPAPPRELGAALHGDERVELFRHEIAMQACSSGGSSNNEPTFSPQPASQLDGERGFHAGAPSCVVRELSARRVFHAPSNQTCRTEAASTRQRNEGYAGRATSSLHSTHGTASSKEVESRFGLHEASRRSAHLCSAAWALVPQQHFSTIHAGRDIASCAQEVGILRGREGRASIGKVSACPTIGSLGRGLSSAAEMEHKREVMEERRFHELADDIMHRLHEKIDEYGEDLELSGFDSDHSQGVLTIRLGSAGTFVLNKQTPNRQIWLSSPISGPARFDWQEELQQWVYKRTNQELCSLLEIELSSIFEHDIELR